MTEDYIAPKTGYELRLPVADQTNWEPHHPKLQEILERGYTTMPLNLKEGLLDSMIEGFYTFTELPDIQKAKLAGKIEVRGGSYGWKRKKAEVDETGFQTSDEKQLWHTHPALEEDYESLNSADTETLRFVNSALELYESAAHALYEQFQEFEEDLPGMTGVFFPDGKNDLSRTNFFHRIISYESGTEDVEFSAKPHYDIGSWTIAIAESGPGLRMGIDADSIEEVDRNEIGEGYAVLFTARMLDRNIGKKLPAGWHDVIQKERAEGLPENVSRWATVMFIDPHIFPKDIPTWEDTHIPVPGGTHRENI